jgi:hypothetical protein
LLPAFDSPSVFGSLLDATQGGFFALAAAIPESLAVNERDAVTEFTLEEGGVAVFSFEQVGSSTELRVCRAEETLDQLMSTGRLW